MSVQNAELSTCNYINIALEKSELRSGRHFEKKKEAAVHLV